MMVYAVEVGFQHLPLHWMWWPATGGVAGGLGGLIFSQALGAGYDVIETLLLGEATTGIIAGILLVNSTISAVSLGSGASGASGGVLAPLLVMGGALGGLETFSDFGPGFWPTISIATSSAARSTPLTGMMFTLDSPGTSICSCRASAPPWSSPCRRASP